MTELFTQDRFRVDQPRRGPYARSRYRVTDTDGTVLAVADQLTRRRGETLKSVFPGKSELDPRSVVLSSPEGDPMLEVDKEVGRMLISVRGPEGEAIGSINTERVGRRYILRDAEGGKVGEITVDISRNHFHVIDRERNRVAYVQKKFAGIATHLLTTADKYDVTIEERVAEPLRTLAVATAIAMDMALHESKDLT
ncbi:phospholipid scramblase-related protein [Actinomadura parmotrematis]|uniref:Scramblase n=1 Tax=Actinomadura parmotrematis TaxID=2864039 RepID=A0ABS7G4A9_9ACTN|nr:phospholipid scramblase-related protein [Actinomadura parmotrematis]MBW8487316.1 hypothetical protein [Actinomadura parmotrematis]